LHTDQERDYFMQRYHDVISSFGGKTSYDADNRPLLVMRSNLWASGYDVDGTDQTSLGQFSGRVQQTYKYRPLLVMRSNLWASGYDVDGTDQTSLGQFSGRVQQTYKHSVPRFFVPEH